MAKAGRKPIEINEKELTSLAAQGLTDQEIMDYFNIGSTTFYRKKRQIEQFRQAVAQGRARGNAAISNKLYNKAAAGDLEAMKFYLERRCGWIRQENLKHEGDMGVKHEHTHEHDVELGPVLTALLQGIGIDTEKEAPKDAPGDSKT